MENLQRNDRNAQTPSAQSEARGVRQKVWTWIQSSLLIAGLALVGLVGAAWLENYFSSRAALKAFNAAQPAIAQSEEDATGPDDFQTN